MKENKKNKEEVLVESQVGSVAVNLNSGDEKETQIKKQLKTSVEQDKMCDQQAELLKCLVEMQTERKESVKKRRKHYFAVTFLLTIITLCGIMAVVGILHSWEVISW